MRARKTRLKARPRRHFVLAGHDLLEARQLLAAALAVVQASPAAGAMNLSPGVDPSLRFDRALDATSLSAGSFVLRDASGNLVPSTVTLGPDANTLRLVPSVALEGMETFTATLKGGAGGLKAADGTALPSDLSWSFTTEDLTALPGPLSPGILIDRTDGLITDAAGGTATFAVVLTGRRRRR